MVRRHNQQREDPLLIMQVNVRKCSSAHDIALSYALINNIDVLLIQEPWIHPDISTRKTKSHQDFEAFSPISTWLSRPRVFTYIRKKSGLRPFQVASDLSRDIVQTVITCGNKIFPIWNVYNAPVGSVDAGVGLSTLLNCTDTPFFIGGDFNLRHPLWDSSASQAQRSCSNFIDWYDNKGLILLNPTNVPTHDRGGTLDLALCLDTNSKCEIRTDLHTTSDHETLVTTIRWMRSYRNLGRLRYNAIDEDLFRRLLGNRHSVPSLMSKDDLEDETENIIETIRTALGGACPRKRPRNYGTPWWNDDCRLAANLFRRARRQGHSTQEKMDFQNTVRKAKKNYWRTVVAETKTLPQAYKIVQWHNATPRYQSPPLRPDEGSEPVFDPHAKARLLHQKLLCRQ